MSASVDPIEKIEIPKPKDGSANIQDAEEITDFKDIASYNWMDETDPAILVPGIPPIWSPPTITPQLSPDSGTVYVDQNTDRIPWSPLEPLVRAVLTLHANFKFDMIDVITDRRPIRKLFGFVAGETEAFEFGVVSVGNTALFVRMEKETRQTIPSGVFHGYRRAFEQEYTKLSTSAKGTTSHHRIFQYKFGGLRFLVRSAVDAYLDDLAKPHEEHDEGSKSKEEPNSNDLVKYMNAASLRDKAPSRTETSEAVTMKVIPGGKSIPHNALLELKTRAKFGKQVFDIEQKMPDLWISQTPNFIVAAHRNVTNKWHHSAIAQPRRAEFPDTDIDILPVQAEVKHWEVKNATKLCKLSIVINGVVDAVRAIGAPCIVRFRGDEPVLVVSKAETGAIPTLPDDLCGNWDSKNLE